MAAGRGVQRRINSGGARGVLHGELHVCRAAVGHDGVSDDGGSTKVRWSGSFKETVVW